MITRQRTLQGRSDRQPMSLILIGLALLTVSAERACGQQSVPARLGEAFDIEVPEPAGGGLDLSTLVKGAVTIHGKGEAILLDCERVGDRVFVAAPVGRKGDAQVAPAKEKGSEVRYAGKGTINDMSFDVPPGHRLCFRKSEHGWVYICGRGRLSGSVQGDFGKTPDPQQVLDLLASDSSLEREGGARNIQLLPDVSDEHQARIVEKLRQLLADTDPVLFSAAAEGLAYIGSDSAYRSLIEAGKAAGTEQHKAIIAECLALLGARRLFLGAGSASISEPEGARLVLSVQKPWVKNCMAERLHGEPRLRERVSALAEHASVEVKTLALGVQSSAGVPHSEQNTPQRGRIERGTWSGKATNGKMWTQVQFAVDPDKREVGKFMIRLGFEPEDDGSLELALEDLGLIDEDGVFDVVKGGRTYIKGRFLSPTQAEGTLWFPMVSFKAPDGGQVEPCRQWKAVAPGEPAGSSKTAAPAEEGAASSPSGIAESVLPGFKGVLRGPNEVRIKNPNDFVVTAGLRSGGQGKDLTVPANGSASVFVPDGKYDIFFVYSNRPDALFQGDSFALDHNGVEIQVVKVVGGNYRIRQVK